MTQASNLLWAAYDAAFSHAESNEQYEFEMTIFQAYHRRAEREIEQIRRRRLAGISSINDVETSRTVSRTNDNSTNTS